MKMQMGTVLLACLDGKVLRERIVCKQKQRADSGERRKEAPEKKRSEEHVIAIITE